jgi:hypothetical protein
VPITTQEIQDKPPLPFPKWLGPTWLFFVYLEYGLDWGAVVLYGGIGWLGGWGLWRLFARSRLRRELKALPAATADKIWHWLARAIWAVFLIFFATTYYVNHYLPHGPHIDTGDVVCQNDGRGPCGESYIEDTRRLNIPSWAKFLRTSEADLLLLGLALAGVCVSYRPKGGYKRNSGDS